jgi:ribosomal-protein-serine acetyltransferase
VTLPLELEGPRIHLRTLAVRDAARVFAVVARNRRHLDRWLPWVVDTRDVSDIAVYIRRSRRERRLSQAFHYGIFLGDAYIGQISIFAVSILHRRGEIGYWLDRSHGGQGYMTEAVAVLVDAARRGLNLDRIEIRVEPGNVASRAIAERLGFTYEGTLRHQVRRKGKPRDHEVFSLLGEEKRRSARAGARRGT